MRVLFRGSGNLTRYSAISLDATSELLVGGVRFSFSRIERSFGDCIVLRGINGPAAASFRVVNFGICLGSFGLNLVLDAKVIFGFGKSGREVIIVDFFKSELPHPEPFFFCVPKIALHGIVIVLEGGLGGRSLAEP